MIEHTDFISKKYVRDNPNKIFLFGDNLVRTGWGGQAKEMRGEPNAVGIPTKKKPEMTNDSFFTDDELWENKKAIDNAFMDIFIIKQEIKKCGKEAIIVIPSSGIGTGFAELPRRAPKTYQYLLIRLKELERM
jgi:hypothetical protein